MREVRLCRRQTKRGCGGLRGVDTEIGGGQGGERKVHESMKGYCRGNRQASALRTPDGAEAFDAGLSRDVRSCSKRRREWSRG